MSTDVKITVITIVKNGERTIERAIRSILPQLNEEIEYLVIDGNSTDSTLEIVNQFSKEINLIISEPDTGIYNAMNKGISIAKGNLIGFLNCDDEYAPGALKIILNSAASVHAGIYHGDTEYVASNGSTSIKRPGPIENITGDPTINHTTCFVTKQTYQQQGDFDEKYKISSDFDLMLRCYLKGVRFHYIPQTLNKFYWGGASSKCYSNVEGYRILKHHKTGKHLSLIPRMIKCYTKNFIKLVIGRF